MNEREAEELWERLELFRELSSDRDHFAGLLTAFANGEEDVSVSIYSNGSTYVADYKPGGTGYRERFRRRLLMAAEEILRELAVAAAADMAAIDASAPLAAKPAKPRKGKPAKVEAAG